MLSKNLDKIWVLTFLRKFFSIYNPQTNLFLLFFFFVKNQRQQNIQNDFGSKNPIEMSEKQCFLPNDRKRMFGNQIFFYA